MGLNSRYALLGKAPKYLGKLFLCVRFQPHPQDKKKTMPTCNAIQATFFYVNKNTLIYLKLAATFLEASFIVGLSVILRKNKYKKI